MTDTTCPDCHHTHEGPKLANICIGCPCPTRPIKPDVHRYGCMTKGCHTARIASTRGTRAEADTEARTLGWIIWTGTTISGKDSTAIYCPEHAGKAAQPDDSTFDGTEAGAEDWAEEHHCEPSTHIIRPTKKQAVA